jgi:hypothetical protein
VNPVRWRLIAAAATLVAAWAGLQFWLTRRAFAVGDAHAHAISARFRAAHPGVPLTVYYTPSDVWVRAGIESVVALLLLVALATALVRGGRGRWAFLVAGLPAAVSVARFTDGSSVGLGWNQPTETVRTWLAAGVCVDTATLLAIVALLLWAVPGRSTTVSATSALFRAAPPAVILVAGGWCGIRSRTARTAPGWPKRSSGSSSLHWLRLQPCQWSLASWLSRS